MHQEKGNSSEPLERRTMQNGRGGGGGEEEAKSGPPKRLRRPSVRLNQPYYENTGPGSLQQRWDAFKKDLEGARKSRTRKNSNVRNPKKSNGEGIKGSNLDDDDDDDDDLAIGSWKNLNAGKRVRDFKSKSKRKRVRPSNSKTRVSVSTTGENEDQEIENHGLSSGGESESQREGNEQEENSGANGVDMDLVAEDSDPHCSFGDDKLIDDDDDGDDNDVVDKQGSLQRGVSGDHDLDDMGGEIGKETENGGVRVWLNELGLGKYAPLFEVHEVDDEVLPFLTLEDLKDMGVSAVGSRRKMFRSIQKLGKGFS